MRKFSSHKLYNFIKYSTFMIALLFFVIGAFMMVDADRDSTFERYSDDCERLNRFRRTESVTGIKIPKSDCFLVASNKAEKYKNDGLGLIIAGVLPMGLLFGLRGFYLYVFPELRK